MAHARPTQREIRQRLADVRNTPGAKLLRDPVWQHQAVAVASRIPALAAQVRNGENAGLVVLRTIAGLASEEGQAQTKRALGLKESASREALFSAIARVAPELGTTAREIEWSARAVNEMDLSAALESRLFQNDVEVRAGSGMKDVAQRSRRTDDDHRRDALERAFAEADTGKRDRVAPSTAMRTDLELAYSAHAGEQLYADPSAPGVRRWMEERTPEEIRDYEAAHVELREDNRFARDVADEYAASLEPIDTEDE